VKRLLFFLSLLFVLDLTAAQRPNIVLIMADDLGFSDLGCYGSEIQTPNLDALASKGLRFSQFYNTAKCHSSRVSLLTGLYCDQAGSASLSRGATIAEVMGQAGYSTSMVGKWHLSKQPTDFGFQNYWGHLSGACNFFTGDNSFRYNGENYEVPKMLNGRPFYATHAMGDFALEFIDAATKKRTPSCYMLHLMLLIILCTHLKLTSRNVMEDMTADGTSCELRATQNN
jgi:arylsulfatase